MRLNHLLFMDNLKLSGSNDDEMDSQVKAVKIVFVDIAMQVGLKKCSVLKIKREKQVHCEGIDLTDGVAIEEANEEG